MDPHKSRAVPSKSIARNHHLSSFFRQLRLIHFPLGPSSFPLYRLILQLGFSRPTFCWLVHVLFGKISNILPFFLPLQVCGIIFRGGISSSMTWNRTSDLVTKRLEISQIKGPNTSLCKLDHSTFLTLVELNIVFSF